MSTDPNEPRSTVVCRHKACRMQVERPQAVAARKVLGDSKARGWYCPRCAKFLARWRGRQ